MAYDLDWKHQRDKPGNRPKKMLDIAGPVKFKPEKMGGNKNNKYTTQRDIKIRGWRHEARHKPYHIRRDDIERKGRQHGEHHFCPFLAHVVGHKTFHAADYRFPE